ncbi:MAG: hypothetical protein NT010_09265 [Proteobacteria bacterium]|nr:hypothetical protein [Pseudomonadota bacterium]
MKEKLGISNGLNPKFPILLERGSYPPHPALSPEGARESSNPAASCIIWIETAPFSCMRKFYPYGIKNTNGFNLNVKWIFNSSIEITPSPIPNTSYPPPPSKTA